MASCMEQFLGLSADKRSDCVNGGRGVARDVSFRHADGGAHCWEVIHEYESIVAYFAWFCTQVQSHRHVVRRSRTLTHTYTYCFAFSPADESRSVGFLLDVRCEPYPTGSTKYFIWSAKRLFERASLWYRVVCAGGKSQSSTTKCHPGHYLRRRWLTRHCCALA